MTQFYIMELQQYKDGSYGDIKHFAYDDDADKARLKAESKFYEVLAAAAVSDLPMHSAIMFSAEGFPLMHQCYKHEVTSDETVPEEEPTPEEIPTETEE